MENYLNNEKVKGELLLKIYDEFYNDYPFISEKGNLLDINNFNENFIEFKISIAYQIFNKMNKKYFNIDYSSKLMDDIYKNLNIVPVLILIGNSGSGKTTLANNLVKQFPDLFTKLPQVTTREKRNNETNFIDYSFIDITSYKNIEDSLISKTCFNNNYYGTLPLFNYQSNKINIIVASSEAVYNLFTKDLDDFNLVPMLVEIIKPYEVLSDNEKRENRNKDFINKEIDDLNKVYLDYNNYCIFRKKIILNNSNFVNLKDILYIEDEIDNEEN